jgi:hypothetical protein
LPLGHAAIPCFEQAQDGSGSLQRQRKQIDGSYLPVSEPCTTMGNIEIGISFLTSKTAP